MSELDHVIYLGLGWTVGSHGVLAQEMLFLNEILQKRVYSHPK